MTLDQLAQAANNGDVESMFTLGNHYFDQKQWTDAWEWLTKAAENGHVGAAAIALLFGDSIARAFESIPLYDKAFDAWSKCYDCFDLVWNNDIAESAKKMASGKVVDIVYGMGYCKYCLAAVNSDSSEYANAKVYFESIAANMDDPRAKVMTGLCYSSLGDYASAFPFLNEMKSNINLGKDGINFEAWMTLALIHRTADSLSIPGVHTNMAAAYQCVAEAAKIPGSCGEFAQKDLQKYRKNFFGKITYIDD